MKLIATLPEAKHYRPLQSNREGRWLFEDRGTSMFRLISPVAAPFGQPWKFVFQPQQQKTDRSQFPYRLNIKLFPVDDEDVPRCECRREVVKGLYAWANCPTVAFYAFPRELGGMWVMYSFF